MDKPCEDLALGGEAAAKELGLGLAQTVGLQRIPDAKLDVLDFVHRPHAALSKWTDDAVVADDVSWRKFH